MLVLKSGASIVVVQRLGRRRVRGVVVADERQRRMAEVLQRRPFAKKLRINRDAESFAVFLARMCFERRDDVIVGRSRQDRASDDNDVICGLVPERIADLLADTNQVAEIEAAVFAARRADANQRQVGISDRLGRARRRPQPTRIDAFLEQRIETRLDDRAAAAVDGGDLLGIDVDADDVMSIGGEVRRGNAADVAQAEYGDSHTVRCPLSGFGIRWIRDSIDVRRCRLVVTAQSTSARRRHR